MNFQRLKDNEFRSLSTFIEESVGIRMAENKRIMLEGRLNKRLRALKIDSFDEYISFAFLPEQRTGELIHMIDVVTTNKTDFFREPDHFDFLHDRLLPHHVSQDNWGTHRPVRVWSAASSTGEEPYTLAMVLRDFAESVPGFSFSVLATDISTKVLETAQRAIYSEEKAQAIPERYRRKYLLRSRDRGKGLVRIRPDLRRFVSFARLNLMDARYPVRGTFEVIFCRNVIIYFDRERQQRLLRKLFDYLVPGGYLFVGHSETLTGTGIPFTSVAPTVYKKAE